MKTPEEEYYRRRGCEKRFITLILIIILCLCCKKTTQCFECFQRKYIITPDTMIVNNYGGFDICDMTQDQIDIFESMNNYRTSTGGTDIDCRPK